MYRFEILNYMYLHKSQHIYNDNTVTPCYCLHISTAPDPVTNITIQFSPFNTTSGVYNITWIPPASTNGSFVQILEYSYLSAYDIGPLYNNSNDSFVSEQLNQTITQFSFNALYFTNYSFNITTYNLKYNISNGPAQMSDQSPPAGMYI